MDYGRFPFVKTLDFLSGVVGDSEEAVGILGGGKVFFTHGADEKFEAEASEGVQEAEAGVFEVVVVETPVVLGGDVAETEVEARVFGFFGGGFSTGCGKVGGAWRSVL